MIVKLLTERHLEFLSITGGCRGPSESTLVKMSNCWKSRALAHLYYRSLLSYYTMTTALFRKPILQMQISPINQVLRFMNIKGLFIISN